MNRIHMLKVALRRVPLLALVVAPLAACDFLDPTDVENPRTTAEDLAEALEPTRSLLPGLRAQFARLINSSVTLTELISDNYSIHGTGLNSALDFPRDLRPQLFGTGGSTGLYWNAQELRALADFVIEDIIPDDETATPDQVAEARYYRGMAFLLLGENVVAAPTEVDGAAQPADVLLGLALDDLNAAAGSDAFGTAANAALARAYRWLDDETAASASAQDVLNAEADFLFAVEYDRASISNLPYAFLVSRALREMQPLPRLDFLDPKYIDFESAIPVAKAEEMHLILAEAAMAQDQWAVGRDHLADAIETALARSTTDFDDDDPRWDASFVVRPRDAEILVAASPTAEFRAGLVLERPGIIPVPTISGTSLDADSIRAIPATSEDALLHALYLARQEILFLEGRRMADLGIRLPMMSREIESNETIEQGDPGTDVFVPAYIPAAAEMDIYSPVSPYAEGTAAEDHGEEPIDLTVEVLHDMNAILVANRTALPFFD